MTFPDKKPSEVAAASATPRDAFEERLRRKASGELGVGNIARGGSVASKPGSFSAHEQSKEQLLSSFDERLARKIAGVNSHTTPSAAGEPRVVSATEPFKAEARKNEAAAASAAQNKTSFDDRLKRKLSSDGDDKNARSYSEPIQAGPSSTFDAQLKEKLSGTISQSTKTEKECLSLPSFDDRLKSKLSGDTSNAQ